MCFEREEKEGEERKDSTLSLGRCNGRSIDGMDGAEGRTS